LQGFYYFPWAPDNAEQVRHGYGVSKDWQPMSELSACAIAENQIIAIGLAGPQVENDGTELAGGLPVVWLYWAEGMTKHLKEEYVKSVVTCAHHKKLPKLSPESAQRARGSD
jgi:hypothetical protein